jgi:pimeloyl-ACP methyl ester carboxylesterase
VADFLFDRLTGRRCLPAGATKPDTPLIVAIHGGTYTSAYFDVPGYSLLDRAEALRIPIIAPDRPGYGESLLSLAGDGSIEGQAHYLIDALEDAWRRYGTGARGMVLIGHSIGGAIAATIASVASRLPIIGVAVSGMGLRTPDDHGSQWEKLPPAPIVEIPTQVKDQLMFGPPGAFTPDMPAASHVANTGAPKAELLDITTGWHTRVHKVLGRITAPVHYRQAEDDALWIVSEDEVTGFGRACSNALRVDAQMMRNTGHCIDFHRVGAALQVQQLGFALQCASQAS